MSDSDSSANLPLTPHELIANCGLALTELERTRSNAGQCIYLAAELMEVADAEPTAKDKSRFDYAKVQSLLKRLDAAYEEAKAAVPQVYDLLPAPPGPVEIAGCAAPRYTVAAVELARRVLEGAGKLDHRVCLCGECADELARDGKIADHKHRPARPRWLNILTLGLLPRTPGPEPDFLEWMRNTPRFDANEAFSRVQLEHDATVSCVREKRSEAEVAAAEYLAWLRKEVANMRHVDLVDAAAIAPEASILFQEAIAVGEGMLSVGEIDNERFGKFERARAAVIAIYDTRRVQQLKQLQELVARFTSFLSANVDPEARIALQEAIALAEGMLSAGEIDIERYGKLERAILVWNATVGANSATPKATANEAMADADSAGQQLASAAEKGTGAGTESDELRKATVASLAVSTESLTAHAAELLTNVEKIKAEFAAKDSEIERLKRDTTNTAAGNTDGDWHRLAAVVGDPVAAQILHVAESDRSADSRMRAIIELDRRFAEKDSNEWANLLRVDPSAIRQTAIWKAIRKRSVELSDGEWAMLLQGDAAAIGDLKGATPAKRRQTSRNGGLTAS